MGRSVASFRPCWAPSPSEGLRSRERHRYRPGVTPTFFSRYLWFYFFTTLFSGGLIPSFLVVFHTGLYNTLWALVVPFLVNVWNIVLMLNFMRGLPKEMEEAAVMDGSGHWSLLWKIVVPPSTPVLATCALHPARLSETGEVAPADLSQLGTHDGHRPPACHHRQHGGR